MLKRKVFYPQQNASLEDLEGIISAQSDNFKEFLLKCEPYSNKSIFTDTFTEVLSDVPELKPSCPTPSSLTIVVSGGSAFLNQDLLEQDTAIGFSLPANSIPIPTGSGGFVITRKDILGIKSKAVLGDLILKDFIDDLGNIQKKPVYTSIIYSSELVYIQGTRNVFGGVRPDIPSDVFALAEVNLRDGTVAIYDNDPFTLLSGYIVDLRAGYIINTNSRTIPAVVGSNGKVLTIQDSIMDWTDTFIIPWTANNTFTFKDTATFNTDLFMKDWKMTATQASSGDPTTLTIQKGSELPCMTFATNINHKTVTMGAGLVCLNVTTVERNNLTSVPRGFMLYNTDKSIIEVWSGTSWVGEIVPEPSAYQFYSKYPYIEEELQKVKIQKNGFIMSVTAKQEIGSTDLILDACSVTTGWAASGANTTTPYLNTDSYFKNSLTGLAIGFYKNAGESYTGVYKDFAPFTIEDRQFFFDIYLPVIDQITGLQISFYSSPTDYKVYSNITTQADGSALIVGVNRIYWDYDLSSGTEYGVNYTASAIKRVSICALTQTVSSTITTSISGNYSPGILLSNLQFNYKLTVWDRMNEIPLPTWTIPSDAGTNITYTTTLNEYKIGKSAVKFDKTTGDTLATISKLSPGLPNVDMTKKVLGFWIKLPSVVNLSSIFIGIYDVPSYTNGRIWGKSTNYLGQPLTVGWNYIEVSTDSPNYTKVGSGVITSCTQIRLGVQTFTTSQTYTGIIISHINYSQDATIDLKVVTKNGTEKKIRRTDQSYTYNFLSPKEDVITPTQLSLDCTSVTAGDYLVFSPKLGAFGRNAFFEVLIE